MSLIPSLSSNPDHPGRQYALGQELRVSVLTAAEETEGRHDVTDSFMLAGAATLLHAHTRYEERLWVSAGLLTVWAGDEKVTLRSGDFYTIPLRVPHAIAAGPDGARALNISTPAGFAEVIARTATPLHLFTETTALDVELFNAVAEEMGDLLLGPPGSTPADLAPKPPGTI
ncbi:cupin domain-containing protein [Streptomyces sp. NPDC057621]|uniref:cupin domain-containing protein n=1 Tax=Streptomyces sp. NPDC057621 TaxID=3346186 RepID=UPI003691CCBC